MFENWMKIALHEYIINMDNVINISPIWTEPGITDKRAKAKGYDVQSIKLDDATHDIRLSTVREITGGKPQRLLFLDDVGVATCSTQYQPLQHTEFFSELEKLIKSYPKFANLQPTNETVSPSSYHSRAAMYADLKDYWYVRGWTEYQVYGVYNLVKNKVFPFDPLQHEFTYQLVVTNSMDLSMGINCWDVWSFKPKGNMLSTVNVTYKPTSGYGSGKARLDELDEDEGNIVKFLSIISKKHKFKHVQEKGKEALKKNVFKYIKEEILDEEVSPVVEWEIIMKTDISKPALIEMAKELMMQKNDIEQFASRVDIHFSENLDEVTIGSSCPIKTMWDLMVFWCDILYQRRHKSQSRVAQIAGKLQKVMVNCSRM